MIESYDNRRDIVVPGQKDITITYCVEHFVKLANNSIADHGAFYVALAGGSSPENIFKLLADAPYIKQVDWSKVWLFWSDERCVPPDDPASNYKMAMDSGLAKLPIPRHQVIRMKGELDPHESAKEYQDKIEGVPFDMIMLGMGDDGHTASLFPDTEALNETKALVVANYVPQKDSWRLTMTFPCINQGQHIVFYIFGEKKQVALKNVLSSKSTLPASRIGTTTHKALFICDEDAAVMVV